MGERVEGTVKWFTRGTGVIEQEGGKYVPVNSSAIVGYPRKTLHQGQRVTMEVVHRRGPAGRKRQMNWRDIER